MFLSVMPATTLYLIGISNLSGGGQCLADRQLLADTLLARPIMLVIDRLCGENATLAG
jgi:hypothetical protein